MPHEVEIRSSPNRADCPLHRRLRCSKFSIFLRSGCIEKCVVAMCWYGSTRREANKKSAARKQCSGEGMAGQTPTEARCPLTRTEGRAAQRLREDVRQNGQKRKGGSVTGEAERAAATVNAPNAAWKGKGKRNQHRRMGKRAKEKRTSQQAE